MKTRRFSLHMSDDGGSVKGTVSGSSGKGTFSFTAEAADFDKLLEKFGNLMPQGDDFIEFYSNDTGTLATGAGEELGFEGHPGVPAGGA